ncbi:MAG: metallophosphoesterase [Anaerolineae bacterium]
MTSPSAQEHGSRPLHLALTLSDLLSRIPPTLITPALAGMAAISAWPWHRPRLQLCVGLLTFLTAIGDGVSLALLPHLGRSFGPVTPPLLALALTRAGLTFIPGALWPTWTAAWFTAVLQLILTAIHLYATWIEPFRLTLTRLELISPKLRGETALRVLHVSDLHFEGWTPRERRLLEAAQELAPDLVLLTGDYLNLSVVDDQRSRDGVRDLLGTLASIAPTYAVTGSPPVDRPDVVPSIFSGLPVSWLLDENASVRANGHHLRLVGVRCTRDREQDAPRLRRLLTDGTDESFTLLLYHSPDLMPEAIEAKVDLYLAGHTHGGQLRVPIFGALITCSDFWKRYEAGLYREGETTLYVSRGLGMEGLGAPRARFLAPPEIVLWHITSDKEMTNP